MVTLITGKRDTGKTTRILSIFAHAGAGDGLCMPKAFGDRRDFIGYDILRLSTGKRIPLARRIGLETASWKEASRLGRFSFCKAGFAFAARAIAQIIGSNCSPVYLDEIGPLELGDGGFHPLLRRLISSGQDLVLSARPSLVSRIKEKYDLPGLRIEIVSSHFLSFTHLNEGYVAFPDIPFR